MNKDTLREVLMVNGLLDRYYRAWSDMDLAEIVSDLGESAEKDAEAKYKKEYEAKREELEKSFDGVFDAFLKSDAVQNAAVGLGATQYIPVRILEEFDTWRRSRDA